MSQRVASGETEHELSALDDVNEAVRVAWQKHEELEERVEEVRQGLREREASLRYAIIDLSLTRENLAEKGGDSQQVRELEFQVAELEESLGKLEKNRGEVFEALGSELDKHREQVAVDEQRRASSHRRLHGQIEAIRHRLSGEEAVALYRTVSRCHAALTGAEPS